MKSSRPVSVHLVLDTISSDNALRKSMQSDIDAGATVFVANGVEQSAQGKNVFSDLLSTVIYLRNANPARKELICLDALTLHDVLTSMPDGSHYKHVIGNIKEIQRHSNDTSKFLSVYLHAQYHAEIHADANIALHCYVADEACMNELAALLAEFSSKLPASVKLHLHYYNGKLHLTKCFECLADKPHEQFRQHTKKMYEEMALQANQSTTAKIFSACMEQMKVASNAKDVYSAALIDADGCVYNVFYAWMLLKVINTFGERILRAEKDGNALGIKILKFVTTYQLNEVSDLSEEVFSRLFFKEYRKLQYFEIELDDDIAKSKANIMKNHLKYFLEHPHEAQTRQFIRFIEKLHPDIMPAIIYLANSNLIDQMVRRAQSRGANKMVFLTGSLRQSYSLDFFNSVLNGSGLIQIDLGRLADYLNRSNLYPGMQFIFDPVLLADYEFQLAPGYYVEDDKREYHQVASIEDNDKLLITYVMMHHANHKYRVKDLDFYDDNTSLFKKIVRAYGVSDTHRLLPNDMRLVMYSYDGIFSQDGQLQIKGSGDVDDFPYPLIESVRTNPSLKKFLSLQMLDRLHDYRRPAPVVKKFTETTKGGHSPQLFAAPKKTVSIPLLRLGRKAK